MARISLPSFLVAAILILQSCGSGLVDVNFSDKQDYMFFDSIPSALLEAFGESNVNFGDDPPIIEGTYKAEMNYSEYRKYVALIQNPLTGEIIENEVEFDIPLFEPTRYYHKFYGQNSHLCSYTVKFNDVDNNITQCDISPINIIGNGDNFTAYYYEDRPEEAGEPRYAVMISGTIMEKIIHVEQDGQMKDTTVRYIENYRYGDYICDLKHPEDIIGHGYGIGTLVIFENLPDGATSSRADYYEWPNP